MLELVDGLQIAAVLVVDDRPEEVEQVVDDLSKHGCAVTQCVSQEAASALLSGGVAFDLVVLDWHLEADNSTVAALVLEDLLDYCFVPVAVWTMHYNKAQGELEEGLYDFPRDMIIGLEKEDNAEVLRQKVIEWLNTKPQTRLGLLWSQNMRVSLAGPIYKLHRLQKGELGSLARYVWSQGFGRRRLAAMALLELLQSLLAREVRDQPQLIKRIVKILEPELKSAGQMPPGRFGDFRSVEMYSVGAGEMKIRTGDIMDLGGEPQRFAVVLTPACDLAHAKAKSDYVLLARASKREQLFARLKKGTRQAIVNHRKLRCHSLPFVPVDDDKIDLIVDFQDVEACLLKNAKTKIEDGTWKIIATVQSPYRENLVQRYMWFMGRIGIPGLPEHVRGYLAGE